MKKIFTLLISIIMLCSLFTGCNKPKYGELLEITEEDSATIDIITLYENYSKGKNYSYTDYGAGKEKWLEITYYNIKPFIYGLMESQNQSEEENVKYTISDEDLWFITDMFFVTETPVTDQQDNTGYENVLNTYNCQLHNDQQYVQLNPIGKTYYENGDIVYSFERQYANSKKGYVNYTVVENKLENVPDILSTIYKTGDKIYKIKDVTGTRDEDYKEKRIIEISSPRDLVNMSADYAAKGYRYGDNLYILTNDIDMAGITYFTPIGRNRGNNGDDRFEPVNGFSSEFDGQGYTIKNLSLDETVPDNGYGDHQVALFDTISKRGIVKNLNVENINISIPVSAKNQSGGSFMCAGFVVNVSGVIDNCHVQGTIYNPTGGGGGFANQLEGCDGTIIQNCTADVDITGCWGMGGFVVNCSQSYYEKQEFFKLYNCASFGSITAGRYDGMRSYYDVGEFGGFADKIYSGVFEKCHVQTPLTLNSSVKYIGGFVANVEGDPITRKKTEFIDCTYSPSAVGDRNIIGMINWKNTHGNYGDAVFTPVEK